MERELAGKRWVPASSQCGRELASQTTRVTMRIDSLVIRWTTRPYRQLQCIADRRRVPF